VPERVERSYLILAVIYIYSTLLDARRVAADDKCETSALTDAWRRGPLALSLGTIFLLPKENV
jgi:hypothetical protein